MDNGKAADTLSDKRNYFLVKMANSATEEKKKLPGLQGWLVVTCACGNIAVHVVVSGQAT